jgi:hypothetical protein
MLGIKDILLGKVTMPKTNEERNEKTDEEITNLKTSDLNELV